MLGVQTSREKADSVTLSIVFQKVVQADMFFVNLVLDLTIYLNINHMFEHRVQKKQIFYGTVHLHCTMTFDLCQGQCFYT